MNYFVTGGTGFIGQNLIEAGKPVFHVGRGSACRGVVTRAHGVFDALQMAKQVVCGVGRGAFRRTCSRAQEE